MVTRCWWVEDSEEKHEELQNHTRNQMMCRTTTRLVFWLQVRESVPLSVPLTTNTWWFCGCTASLTFSSVPYKGVEHKTNKLTNKQTNSLSLSVCVCVSLPPSLPLSVCVSLPPSLPLCVCVSLSLSPSPSLSLCVCVSLSLSLSQVPGPVLVRVRTDGASVPVACFFVVIVTGFYGGNPGEHGENMQTPHRKAREQAPTCCTMRDLNPQPSCCYSSTDSYALKLP